MRPSSIKTLSPFLLTTILGLLAPAAGPLAAQETTCRTLTVTNTGSSTVWIGAAGGSVVPACVQDGTVCLADPSRTNATTGKCSCTANDPQDGNLACPPDSTPSLDGSSCLCGAKQTCGAKLAGATTACGGSPSRCFWTFPKPTSHGKSSNPWELMSGESASFCLARATNWGEKGSVQAPVWWSGGVFGRTGCQDDGTRCATGDCTTAAGLKNSNCPAGVGGMNPFAQAEFTLQVNAVDFYDVTVINGISTAISMTPTGTEAAVPAKADPSYWCKAPGSPPSAPKAEGCSWNVVPTIPNPAGGSTDQTTLLLHSWLPCDATKTPSGCPSGFSCTAQFGACYQECSAAKACPGNLACVDGYCQCSSSSDCAALGLPSDQQYCGTQFMPGLKTQFMQLCGSFAGWWSADDFCALASTYGPLDCQQNLGDGDGASNTTLQQLFGCTGANAQSCYQDGAGKNCCGCATDSKNKLASSWPAAPTGYTCYGNNTTWASKAQPWLAYLKQACPSAYTYPYDDATSTFNCSTIASPTFSSPNTESYEIKIWELTAPVAKR